MTTEEYIIQHLTDDVRDLALRTPPSGVDLHHALIQISGWQKSRAKLPLWASTPGIHYPQHLSMEQCSSQLTAEYKLSIIQRLCPSGGKMADLTAGFGVDATILGSHFSHLTLVEQNPELCQLLRHNLPLLGIHDFTVHCADSTTVSTTVPFGFAEGSPATVPSDSSEGIHTEGTPAESFPHFDFIFLDPARRDINGRKTVLISDCTPDVCTMQESLLRMSDTIMIKLSPMLDLTTVRRSLSHLTELHIVSVNNECKEVLAIMQKTTASAPAIYCINITPQGTSTFTLPPTPAPESPAIAPSDFSDGISPEGTTAPLYLYEPNASFMKAGIHDALIQAFPIKKIHPNSHLYLSHTPIPHFPGRQFRVLQTIQPNKAGIRQLRQLRQANITVRNYPLTADQLRQRLQLRDGGSTYLFATTVTPDKHQIYVCEK